jgi:hypothetical protein
METLNLILEFLKNESSLPIIAGVIATFSAIAAVTPTPKEGTKLAVIYKIVDFLALNIFKAKDKGK